MDLDRCPKCGEAWGGGDKCRNCGFVPIGAGLDKLPKKKKRRARRYVEPGSSGSFLSFTFLVILGVGAYRIQPWQDDWEFVRALFGQGRRHSLVGEWQIVRTIALKKSDSRFLAGRKINKGTFKFTKKGTVSMSLQRRDGTTSGEGKYAVLGQLVSLSGLRTSNGGVGTIPAHVKMTLAWTGSESLVASTPTEAIYLRKRKAGSPILPFMSLGLKPGKAEAPGTMRGVIATMQNEVNENLRSGE